MSLGSIINNMLDKILPDIVGDLVGCAVDAVTANPQGLATNAIDAMEDVIEPLADGPVAQAFARASSWWGDIAA